MLVGFATNGRLYVAKETCERIPTVSKSNTVQCAAGRVIKGSDFMISTLSPRNRVGKVSEVHLWVLFVQTR